MLWHGPIIPPGCPGSSVGAAAFHDRVRDGNGWVHRALGHQSMHVMQITGEKNEPAGCRVPML